jgi:D-alanyl-D-alanine carboxypeptidase
MKKIVLSLLLSIITLVTAQLNTDAAVKDDPKILSESAVLIDSKTGRILTGKNENKKMYPASLTKIATAIFAIEKGNLTDSVTISAKAAAANGSSVFITEGEKLPLKQLVEGLLINSGNDAGVAIAEHLSGSQEQFAKDLNDFLKNEVQIKDTNFTNPHGLFNPKHITTANDLAKITQFAMKNPVFRDIFGKKELPWHVETWDTILVTHHRLLKGEQLYKGITGGKTGYVSQSGNTLVTTAKRGNLELIAVTLKANTAKQAYKDTKELLNYGFSHYTTAKIGKNETFSLDGKTFSINKDQYFTQLINEKPVFHTEKNGTLSVRNEIGELIGSFDLELVGKANEIQNVNNPAKIEERNTSGIFRSIASWIVVILILSLIIKFVQIRKRRNNY